MSTYTVDEPTLNNDGFYISNIALDLLQLAHAGKYICSASYSLNGISSQQVQDNMTISIISEFILIK